MTNSNTKVPSGRDRETRNGNILRKQQAAEAPSRSRGLAAISGQDGTLVRECASFLASRELLCSWKLNRKVSSIDRGWRRLPRSVGLRVSPDDDAYEPPRVIVESIASRDTLAVWRMLARLGILYPLGRWFAFY